MARNKSKSNESGETKLPVVFHPVAEMFPLIEGPAFETFVEDMKEHGQRQPALAIKHPDKIEIVDGRNRYRANERLRRPTIFRWWDGKGSLATEAASLNFHRRHLTPTQKAAAAVAIEEQYAVEAEARMKAGKKIDDATPPEKIPGGAKGEARDLAARICDVNPRYISDAKLIKANAPELFAAMVAGTTTIAQAKREVHRAIKRATFTRKLSDSALPASIKIITGDGIDGLATLKRGSVRLIFADPPYNIGIDYGKGSKADQLPPQKYLGWCNNWMVEAHRVLSDDGSLWILISDEFAAEYVVDLKAIGFTLRSWIKWYETFGVNCSERFNRTSRHLLYCTKHPDNVIFHKEAVNRRSDREAKYGDKRAASGGKVWDDVWGINPPIPRLVDNAKERIPGVPTQLPLALVRPIVECASDPGDLVVDPFVGSGTTARACLLAGRHFMGWEVSKKYAELARVSVDDLAAQNGRKA